MRPIEVKESWRLGFLVTPEDLGKENLLQFLRYRFSEFHIPTEFVIFEPNENPVPKTGRIYKTDLYCFKNQIMNYETFKKHPDYKGTGTGDNNADKIYLKEVWYNQGSDGHTEYMLVGYCFVDDKRCSAEGRFDYWIFNNGHNPIWKELCEEERQKMKQYGFNDE